MMRLGIFAKTFHRPTLGGVLETIAASSIREVHFNLACAGLETLPTELSGSQCHAIREAFSRHELSMCGISGTFNAIHPDNSLRREMAGRACRLIERCSELGTGLVTLCTGTRNPQDMWMAHPDNCDPSAWDDLCVTLNQLLQAAQQHQVVLGIEPEQGNVIYSAVKARRLLDQFNSPNLKIAFDAANLFHPGNRAQMESVLNEAIDLLGPEIMIPHAKDIPRRPGGSAAAGQGLLDWKCYLQALTMSGFSGPLVMHGLNEAEVPSSLSFLKRHLGRFEHTPQ